MVKYIHLWVLHVLVTQSIHSVMFKHKHLVDEQFFNDILVEANLMFSVCVKLNLISENTESLINSLKKRYITILFSNDDSAYFDQQCQSLVLFEKNNLKCDFFSKTTQNYLSSYYNIIIIIEDSKKNVFESEYCVDSFDSANVLLVFLQNSKIFVLSSSSLARRHFISRKPMTTSCLQPKDLQGQQVRIFAFHYSPFVEIKRNKGSVKYGGVELNLWKDIASHLNLSWSLVEPEGSPWGKELANGSVVGGISGALQTKQADIAFGNIWHHISYLTFAEFGPVLNTVSITFLVHRPHRLTDRWMSLIQIFHWLVWLSTLLALVAASLTYWTINRSMYSRHTPPSLMKGILVMFGALTVSSYQVRSSLFSQRVLAGSWYYFTLLFTNTVMSLIVTKLALPSFSPRIDTVQQLVMNNYHWTQPVYIARKIALQNFYFNLNDSWQRQFEEKYNFMSLHELKDYFETIMNRPDQSEINLALPVQLWGDDVVSVDVEGVIIDDQYLHSYRVMRTPTRSTFSSFVFRKQFHLSDIIYCTTQWYKDLGLWSYWTKNIGKKTSGIYLLEEKDLVLLNDPEKLTIVKLYPLFVLLLLGLTLAFLVFLAELCFNSFMK